MNRSVQKVALTVAGAVLSTALIASATTLIKTANRVSILETRDATVKETLQEIKSDVRAMDNKIDRLLRRNGVYRADPDPRP